MDISIIKKENSSVVTITGRLDSITSPVLEERVSHYTTAPQGDIIMDFSRLEYISSAGLRVLLNISKVMRKHSCNFSICSTQDHVREVFEISGFDTIIPMYNSIEECCSRAKSSGTP